MEIKVGDKVRVSKDAPKLLFTRSICNYPEYVFEVRVIEDDLADIYYGAGKIPIAAFVIPTKYLIKVEDEAKEPKFKVGDKVKDISSPHDSGIYKVDDIKKSSDGFLYHIQGLIGKSNVKESDLEPYTESAAPTIKVGDFVRVLENLHEPICLDVERHLEITNMPPHAVSQKEWKVISVEMRRDCAGRIYTLKHDDSFIYNIPEDCVERVEPKEQTEAEKKPNIGSITIPVEVDLTDSYWDTYTADLAHDLALKVANKYSDPKEAADYAASVAKAVVENLKKK